ncbi:MAG: phytanoyl-CoA dioxygenase [Gammaproteobacteria bacterium]|nr:phytanoyl-CoA dioxygenase [Gammaproteobacteria bacterium]
MLSEAQVRQYEQDGYTFVRGVLEPHVLQQLRDVTDRIIESAAEVAEHTNVLDLEASHTPERPRVRRIKQPHLVDDFYRDLAGYQPVMDALIPLMGEHIRLRAGGKINIKAPTYGSPVEWHQDWAFYPHTNQSVLAVGILLDDMTEENGPLQVVPGTHRGPVLDHHSHGAFCGAINAADPDLDVSSAVTVTGKAGDMSIHHARLIHGSAMNTSTQPRRVLFFEYAAVDAWPLAGVESVGDLTEFNSRIVHGQPTLQPRLEDVPVRLPLPRAVYQGSIYENQRETGARYFDQYEDASLAAD